MPPARSPAGHVAAPASTLIEVRVAELRQLFDKIDPSPFRERDLDVAPAGSLPLRLVAGARRRTAGRALECHARRHRVSGAGAQRRLAVGLAGAASRRPATDRLAGASCPASDPPSNPNPDDHDAVPEASTPSGDDAIS
jgi:hypothetical protein